MRFRWLTLAIAGLMVVTVAACGDDDDSGSAAATTAGTAAGGGAATTAAGGGGGAACTSVAKGTNTLPDKGSINLMSAGEPEEVQAYQKIFDDLINAKTKYKVEIESVGDFEQQFPIRAEGGTLDVAAAPQPGAIPGLVDKGELTSLEDLGINIDQLKACVGASFVELGAYKGKHYGVPTNINLKSMVWYPKAAFDAKGYKVPTTWQEMLALSDKILADGGTPWCVGFESGGATGWPGTDWVEDIMLRTAGVATYDKWWQHQIPFNDPAVKKAFQLFGDVMFGPNGQDKYVLGGAANTPDVAFGDAPLPMFQSPPKCWLMKNATFINSFFPKTAVAGKDYDWFPFPKIDQDGTLYAGELTVIGKNANRAEVADFLSRFVAQDVQCKMGGVQASSRVSPNISVGQDCYVNSILAASSKILSDAQKAGTARFDASDLMPAAVGSGSEWTGVVKYMKNGPSSLDGILSDIEASWPK